MKPWQPPKKLEKDHGEELRVLMRSRGWLVEKVHGSLFMKGWPDYYCEHPRLGHRWIEMKIPDEGRLHKSQLEKFAKWQAHGVKILIATTVADYEKVVLPNKPNWWKWTGPKQWKK